MPNPKPSDDFRNVGIMARGDVLRAIVAQSEADGVSLPRAALSLIEHAISLPSPAATTLTNLETVQTNDLIDELVGRLMQIDDAAALAMRADAAEAKLAMISSFMTGTAG